MNPAANPSISAGVGASTYDLAGMHCQACVRRLTQDLTPLAESVTVTLAPPQAVLVNSQAESLVLAAIAQAGSGQYSGVLSRSAMPGLAKPLRTAELSTVELAPAKAQSWLDQVNAYKPLLLILAYLLAVCGLIQWLGWRESGRVDTQAAMQHFMAGFFMVFSFFKLLNLRAFADAYAGYDVLAGRYRVWGFIYPFVELGLGLAYIVQGHALWLNLVTIIVMGFSSIGVIRSVLSKQRIQCACLGTVFNLPMSTVTIVEDLGMVAMAVLMIGGHAL